MLSRDDFKAVGPPGAGRDGRPTGAAIHGRAREAISTAAALLFCFLWAGAYVGAKVALRDVPPLSLLTVRFGLAALLLAPLALAFRSNWPGRALWPRVIGLGLTTNAIYLGMTFHALVYTSASLAAVIASSNPLLLAAIAPLAIGERPSRQTVFGLVLGFLGVVAVMLPRLEAGQDSAVGAATVLLAVGSLVSSTVLFKRLPAGPGLLAITTVQLAVACLALLPFALVFEGALPAFQFQPAGLIAFLFLSLGVSIGGSLIWFWLLANGAATRVSAWYFLTPVIGIALASLFLGESFGWREVPGLVAVTAGIVIVNRPSSNLER